ncbi:uncharacterized protein LOC133324792 [Musca vetustissima]|uniref:uncharacterized protein LOC133324792 n=1 Tax=Musca vetustissima TaxID=27455 RepID=UPI002AB5FD50|nr:uncharacterized protein LOC133324792 [Musca vetustissima]
MGHRFSKTAATATKTQQQPAGGQPIINGQELSNQTTIPPLTTTGRIPIPSNTNTNSHIIGPTINFQIQESPTGGGLLQPEGGAQQQSGGSIIDTTTTCLQHNLSTAANSSGILQQSLGYNGSASSISGSCSNSLTSVNNLSCGRQIIIKIQLAKMENGNEVTTTTTTTTTSAPACSTNQADISLEALTADCNLNSTELLSETSTGVVVPTTQILNVTLNSAANSSSCSSSTNNLTRTAGSSFSSATVVIPSSSSSSK